MSIWFSFQLEAIISLTVGDEFERLIIIQIRPLSRSDRRRTGNVGVTIRLAVITKTTPTQALITRLIAALGSDLGSLKGQLAELGSML